MGTRSLTRIIPRQEGLAYDKAHERPELALANIYQQYDGYPEYMAVEYAKWLEGLSIGNGLGRTPQLNSCLLYTSPSPRDRTRSRMPSSA